MTDERNDTNLIEGQLTIKRPLTFSAHTENGHVQVNGQVTSLGHHHFRVTTEKPIALDLFMPQQKVKVRLLGKENTLPLTCRFLRVDKNKPTQVVLSMPEGEWITNRRAFVRAPIELVFEAVRSNGEILKGVTSDVSGGGVLLSFESTDKVKKGENIELRLFQRVGRRTDVLKFQAKVVREESHDNSLKYGLKFVNAKSREQNRICKMVIVEEFEQRRQELRDIIGRSENQ